MAVLHAKRGKMLKDYTVDELIVDLMIKCGFGAVTFPIEPVSGGLMESLLCSKTG